MGGVEVGLASTVGLTISSSSSSSSWGEDSGEPWRLNRGGLAGGSSRQSGLEMGRSSGALGEGRRRGSGLEGAWPSLRGGSLGGGIPEVFCVEGPGDTPLLLPSFSLCISWPILLRGGALEVEHLEGWVSRPLPFLPLLLCLSTPSLILSCSPFSLSFFFSFSFPCSPLLPLSLPLSSGSALRFSCASSKHCCG